MTPIIVTGAKISRVTVGALDDIGYTVNYDGADRYTKNDLGASCQCNRRLGDKENALDDAVIGNHPHRARGLSDQAHQKARAEGLAFLSAFPDQWWEDNKDGRALNSHTGQYAVVYVEENGEIYAVHVRP